MSLLTQDQIKAERLRAMARVFGKADSILFGERISCSIVDEPHIKAPGYSTGADIMLNLPNIGAVETTDDIIKVTGLNFHELAHCMFTPRSDTDLVQVVKRRLQYATFNMLEDQRIESMLAAMYPAIEPYFTMTVMKYIASERSGWDMAHLLTYGRRYLPAEVRAQLAARFKFQNLRAELEALIDEYRVAVFPRDDKRGLEIVSRVHELINGQVPQDPYGHGIPGRPDISEGEAPEDDQDAGAQWIEYRDEEQEEAEDDNNADADDADGSGSDSDDDDADGNGNGGGDASDDDSDDGDQGEGGTGGDKMDSDDGEGAGTESDRDDDSDKSKGDGKGRGCEGEGVSTPPGGGVGDGDGRDVPPVTDKALEDMLEEAAKAAASRPEVQADAKAKEASMKNEAGQIPDLDTADYSEKDAMPDFMFASNAFKKELSKLWVDSDPGWHTHRASGRVNVQRAMRGGDLDTVFDSWNEGKNDATSIELVILFDHSGSMNHLMVQASQSLWAIKRAVESIGGDVTVIGFTTDAVTMYDKRTKVNNTRFRQFWARGLTNPRRALDQARMIFHYSKKVHKICLFITDGLWSAPEENDATIEELHKHGIMTALGFISQYPMDLGSMDPLTFKAYTHGVQSYASLVGADGLIDLAKAIVKKGMLAKV